MVRNDFPVSERIFMNVHAEKVYIGDTSKITINF